MVLGCILIGKQYDAKLTWLKRGVALVLSCVALALSALPQNLVLKVVSEIHDPVTTTDELIPSGETSSYRSNPLGLAEYTLSRKDPAYVGRAKQIQVAEKARWEAKNAEDIYKAYPEVKPVLEKVNETFGLNAVEVEIGSVVYAVKPGDGSAREQAASCQKVLGGLANIAKEYATKRYRSNLINWGMLPFLFDGDLPFELNDYILVKDIKQAIVEKKQEIEAYVVTKDMQKFTLKLGDLTDDEREIITKGCLINYYRG